MAATNCQLPHPQSHILLPAAPHSHLNRYRGSRSSISSGSITQRPLAGQNSTIECAREKSINRQTDGTGRARGRKRDRDRERSRQRVKYAAGRKTARQREQERDGKLRQAIQIDRGIDR